MAQSKWHQYLNITNPAPLDPDWDIRRPQQADPQPSPPARKPLTPAAKARLQKRRDRARKRLDHSWFANGLPPPPPRTPVTALATVPTSGSPRGTQYQYAQQTIWGSVGLIFTDLTHDEKLRAKIEMPEILEYQEAFHAEVTLAHRRQAADGSPIVREDIIAVAEAKIRARDGGVGAWAAAVLAGTSASRRPSVVAPAAAADDADEEMEDVEEEDDDDDDDDDDEEEEDDDEEDADASTSQLHPSNVKKRVRAMGFTGENVERLVNELSSINLVETERRQVAINFLSQDNEESDAGRPAKRQRKE